MAEHIELNRLHLREKKKNWLASTAPSSIGISLWKTLLNIVTKPPGPGDLT